MWEGKIYKINVELPDAVAGWTVGVLIHPIS